MQRSSHRVTYRVHIGQFVESSDSYNVDLDIEKLRDGRVVCSSIKVSICFLSMCKCCIEYPIEILRLARSEVIKFLTPI